jgi:hypothetical protein
MNDRQVSGTGKQALNVGYWVFKAPNCCVGCREQDGRLAII